MSARNFPPSFWNSNYQASAATVTSHHPAAAELYGDPYHHHSAATASADPWHSHYQQYSPAAAHHHHRYLWPPVFLRFNACQSYIPFYRNSRSGMPTSVLNIGYGGEKMFGLHLTLNWTSTLLCWCYAMIMLASHSCEYLTSRIIDLTAFISSECDIKIYSMYSPFIFVITAAWDYKTHVYIMIEM